MDKETKKIIKEIFPSKDVPDVDGIDWIRPWTDAANIIKYCMKKYPNDMELGLVIRKIFAVH